MEEPICPQCDTEFDSWAKLRVHHTSAHGESLPNTECKSCGDLFYSEYAKYCSDDCRQAEISQEGEENPNYRGAKEKTACTICDDEFEYYPSEKSGLYCPNCVESEDWRPQPDITGSKNPRWKGGKMEFDCAVCGTTIERYPSDVTGEVTVCDRECLSDWLSEAFTGDGHPNWKGGDTGNYGPGWNRVRREALERDGYQCVICGATKADIGRNPDVHHIVPVRVFAESEGYEKTDAHRLDNVVSLCLPCHRKADFGQLSKDRLWRELGDEYDGRPGPLNPAAPVDGI